jgi:hypothetical protein
MSARIGKHFRTNVIAYVALFFALGGTAYALGVNSVKSKHIVDNQVKSADVRDDTFGGGGLGANDLQPGSVGTSELTDESLSQSDLAPSSVGSSEIDFNVVGRPEIADNTIGSGELLAIDEVTVTTDCVDTGCGEITATAPCPAGKQIISGGFDTNGLPGASWEILQSRRTVAGGWVVVGQSPQASPSASLTAYAYCLTI